MSESPKYKSIKLALLSASAALVLLFGVSMCAAAGPYLELGLGDFVVNEWPQSPDCECGVYLGNGGPLGYVEAGIESPPYNVFWKMHARIKLKYLHISDTSTGQDTGLDAAFVTVRFE